MENGTFTHANTFFPSSELWRSRKIDEGIMQDVYDGKIWSDFQFYDNEPFLSEPGNYGLKIIRCALLCIARKVFVVSSATMLILVVLSAGKSFQGILVQWTLQGLIEKIGEALSIGC